MKFKQIGLHIKRNKGETFKNITGKMHRLYIIDSFALFKSFFNLFLVFVAVHVG